MLALLDSGCEQSVIGRNLIRKVPLEPTEEKLSTADGTDLPLLGETVVHFSIAGFSTSCRVVVTEAVTDLILGIEWLQRNQCVWDFGSNSFTIKGHRGRLKCRRTKRLLRRILVNEEVVIPGLHTTNVPVLVTRSSLGPADQSWGFTQKMRDDDLIIASAIYGSDNVQSVCQVMNMSDKPRRLNRGTELGWAEPVDVIGTEEVDQVELEDEVFPLDLTQNRIRQIQDPGPTELDSEESQLAGSRVVDEDEPDFIQDMLNKMDVELSTEQEDRVKQLLHENREVFSTSEFDLGRTNLVQHRIDTGINRPFKQQLRRHPMAYLPVIDEHVDKMLANDICEPSFSPWASNVVLVKKSDGTLRFCIDYRQLNNLTVKDSYPLPRIDTCFDALGGARYFSTLDLRQGYWQVENDPETADKTTFITRKGAFKFKVLPFGLSNAPAVFQRLMNLVMQGLTWEACLVFLDDIIVLSSTFEQHLERLEAVFQRLRWANLKLKPSKCKLFQLKVKFLGSVVSEKGIEPDPDKLTAISEWPVPENLTEVRAFVGLASYYRRHVEGFSDIAKPLSELTKKNQPFLWGPEQQSAFDKLKYCLTHYPVLAPPIPGGKYIIDTDASDFAMGAVLQQEQHGTVRVIAYASKTFDAAERMYCTTRKELAAVIYALKMFRHYVVGGVLFLLRTDHGALTSLFKTPEPIQQQARYLNFLADYNFEIQHRAGSQHGNSDGLSRRPCGSKKCTRADCELSPSQPRKIDRSQPASKNMGPLRSGNAYQKDDGTKGQPARNLGTTESVLFPDRRDMKMIDLSWDSIRQSQETDVTLQKIFELLRDSDAPTEVNQFGMGVVHLWNQRKSLEIINGVIHRNYETAEGLILYKQILVPAPLREKFLYWVHGDPTSGHFGVQKTADKLQRYAYWSGWRKDTELFVRRCDKCCRYRKGPTRPQGLMKNGVGLAPFQKFHIDLTGPHRRSSGGHVYLLTGICCFTKYLVVVPLKDKSALTVANALLKHVYLIYGAVELQVHDNGPEFVNAILGHLSRMMGIQDLRSTPYRPVANSAIERTHRTINAVFAKTIKEHQKDWHEQAKYVCFAYNTAKHSSTTFSPFYLVFLREPRVGIDLFLDRSEPAYQDTDEYSGTVRERMQKAYQIVSNQLKVTFDRAKRRYDQRVRAVHFPLHSYVWFFCPRLTAGRGRKFKKLTDGPYRIVRILNDVNYVIQKVPGARLQICHVDRLMRYEGEVPPVWIRFDQENQNDRPNPGVPQKASVPRVTLESHPGTKTNGDRRDSIRRIGEKPAIRNIRSIKIQQNWSTEGATLGHSPMGNERGGAINRLSRLNRLSWAQQATNRLWPTATDSGPTGCCYRAGPAATIKGDDLPSGFISNSALDQSSRIMTAQYKSKEFISSSDGSDFSDNGKVTVGFGESERIAKQDKNKDRHKTKVKGSSSRSSDDRSSGTDHRRHDYRSERREDKHKSSKTHGHGSSSHGHGSSSGSKRERRSPVRTSTVTSSSASGDSAKRGGQFKTPLPPTKSADVTKTKALTSVVVTPSSSPSAIGSSSSQSKVSPVNLPTTKQTESKSQIETTKNKNDSSASPAAIGSGRHSTTSLSSASTEEDSPQLKWGPNLKRTRKIPTFAGPWYCQLCNGQPLMTVGGMRKHYKSHYKLWDSSTNTLVDMNEAERAHQELMKELRAQGPRVPSASATGAQPIKLVPNRPQFLGLRNEPSAARGVPPPEYDSGSTSTSIPSGSKSSVVESRQEELATPEPTLRIPTKPRRLSTGTRDRQLIIQSPIKMTVPVRKDPIFAPPVDRCPEIEPDSEPEDEDVVWLEEEPKPKVKNEFLTFEQVVKNPTMDTLTQLLLFGVDATIQRVKRQIWPALTESQEDQLRQTYEILLIAVPLVRQLDSTVAL